MTDERIKGAIQGAADFSLKTPCEKIAARREAFRQRGVANPELLLRMVDQEYHNEAIEAGTPCPCGREYQETVTLGGGRS
ncbi:hypothetical protein LVO79_21125 (plasmid) [Roseivivax marinus]|uniref:hypothetical protein n=1 Tax=Roseivivax marinus TaxID=1379903 RepID=UPI001F043F18|nr:hypothetical protein [Roseivivax marinus]UMA67284.1 hypothetical protein LVO79_21125 [Roseivivax marinus]